MTASLITVTELNRRARACLEHEFPLLWIVGEVSNLTRASSGHVYFNLKDESAQVRCVMFRQRAQLVPWQLANGQEVEINARISLYEARGDFQLGVESMRRGGLGRLYENFARLRAKLEAEGLFASARKRPLPNYPQRIGVITSLQAAALHDVLAALSRRSPHVEILVFPTPVQGPEAAPGICRAIEQANHLGHKRGHVGQCDVILLVRGGGSIEDLCSFNEEAVARAIIASRLPIISGIGHESDTTIADLVADQRAATPTAAAELASSQWLATANALTQLEQRLRERINQRLSDLQQQVDLTAARLIHPATRLARSKDQLHFLQHRLTTQIQRHLTMTAQQLSQSQARLRRSQPNVDNQRKTLRQVAHQLQRSMTNLVAQCRQQFRQTEHTLSLLNPHNTLARGYAIVRTDAGRIALSPQEIPLASTFQVQLAQGHIHAQRTSDDDVAARDRSHAVVPPTKPD